MNIIVLIFMLIPSLAFALTEVSTPSTNVGIGTTSVKNAVTVSGGVSIGGTTYNNTTAPSNGLIVQGNVGVGSLTPGTALDVNGVVRATSFSGTFATGGWTSSTGKVLLTTSSDNVGIGSATPGASLDITGTSRSTGGYQVLGSGSGKVGSSGGVLIDGANAPATTPGIFVTTSNNVGVGTNAAASKLTVEGTAEVKGFKLTTNPSATYVLTSNTVGVGTWMPQASSAAGNPGGSTLQLQRNNGGSFDGVAASKTDSNGNIGIGTTTTAHALDIGGHVAIISTGDTYFNLNSGNVGIGTNVPIAKLSVVGGIGIGTVGGNAFVTTAAPSGGMIIQGNVGIGSLAPGQKLDISGRARFIGIGTTVPQAACIKADGTLGYYTTTAFAGSCS